MSQTQRRYMPFGIFATKKEAQDKIKEMPWPCVVCKGANGTWAIVRKDK